MKKKAAVLLLVILLLSGQAAYAGDIPESIMLGNHEAMFIGEVVSMGSTTMCIKPLTVMMGTVTADELEVKRFKSYSIYPHNPKKGDVIVALLNDATSVDETWVFECSSSDYKTLQIICDEEDMVLRYQKYINEGAYFDAQKRLNSKASAGMTRQATMAPSPAQTDAQMAPFSETAEIAAVAAGGAGGLKGYAMNWDLAALIVLLLVLAIAIAALLYRRKKRRILR